MPLSLTVKEDKYCFSGRSFNITKDKNELLKPYQKQLLNYGVVLRLSPTKEQQGEINCQIGNARFVRNNYLNERINLYKEEKKTLTVSTYKKEYLPKLKKENDFLEKSDKFAIEAAIEHVDNAYKKFFDNIKKGKTGKKSGFPKFVSKYKPNGNQYTTKFTNNNIELLMGNDKLPYIKLPKLGYIRVILPLGETVQSILPENTRITSVSIKRHNNDYTVSLQLEAIIDEIIPIHAVLKKDIYAMDVGIKYFGTYGNEEKTEYIENPRWIKRMEKRLRKAQQSLSRKKYDKKTHTGSKNWEKAKVRVTQIQAKIKNQRKDFQHKLSRRIADECKVFICENLSIQGMVKNRHLSKAISSCSWGQFCNFVKYKVERMGGIFIKVDRFFASSKLCSHCGYKNTELTLSDREWTCPQCNTKHERDENAKSNLLKEGIRLLTTERNVTVTV